MKATLKRKTQKFVEDGKKHEVWQQGRSYNLGRFILSLTLLSGVLYMLFVLMYLIPDYKSQMRIQ